MSYSLFDIVGPVMHGPSSSHTAGANKIGYMAKQIFVGDENKYPSHITFSFHKNYMKSYKGQRSDVALMAGILGFREYDTLCNTSLEKAKELGITWDYMALSDETVSKNTMNITAVYENDTYTFNGISVGGGNILIDDICGKKVNISGTKDMDISYTTLNGKTIQRHIKPLSPFMDKGNEPILSTFEDCLNLAKAKTLDEIAIDYEMTRSGVTEDQVLDEAVFIASVMKEDLEKRENMNLKLIGGIAKNSDILLMDNWSKSNKTILDPMFSKTLERAMIMATRNASGARVVASPTGGAAGTLPAIIITMAEKYNADEEKIARAILVAALTGLIIGNVASFSGTVGGCQSEIGIGAAMAASAACFIAGGNPKQSVNAACITIKNILGLSCDAPLGFVEVPCIKRNAMGVSVAYFGAELAMAGIESAIAPDKVVKALADTQRRLPPEIKFGGTGGLAGV